jgi:hypothetical protein
MARFFPCEFFIYFLIGVDYELLFVNGFCSFWQQFDAKGKLMQKVSTKLAASSYGEDELISLIQT